jgi:hypothetical protein
MAKSARTVFSADLTFVVYCAPSGGVPLSRVREQWLEDTDPG